MRLIIGAFFLYRTGITLRLSSGAVVSSEEDKWMMQYSFFLFTKYLFDHSIGLIWSFCIHDTDTIHHSMDVSIDSDIGHIIEY
jgi:hypothetical protein